MKPLELLRRVYESIEWDRLYELAPQASRREVDELFQTLRGLLGPEPDADAAAAVTGGAALVYCDGASRGNPGPAGIGMVIATPGGDEVLAWGESIGRATNNVAEYRAVIAGLEKALALRVRSVHLLTDSELLVRQLNGEYQVKSAGLKPLHAEVQELLARFGGARVGHIPRAENARADALASRHARAKRR
jgi:ribonuclease HI